MINLIFFLLAHAAQGHTQNYDLYPSTGKPKAPVLVFVHGGAWVVGKKEQYREFAQKLGAQNLCVAVVDYRLAPATKHPQPVEDFETTLRKLGEAPASPKCDFSRLYLMGHSAGAHLIAFWDSVHVNSKVKGFIGIEGIYDLNALDKKWPAYREQFLTAEFGDSTKWTSASPITRKMKSVAPWLVIHSRADELVDEDQSLGFMKHLERNNKIHTQMLELASEKHFAVLDKLAEQGTPANKVLREFILKNP